MNQHITQILREFSHFDGKKYIPFEKTKIR